MSSVPLKLLVVDDDAIPRQLLARALSQLRYEVNQCGDGMEAIQILKETGPALLVLDYEMPELNGAEVSELIRKGPDPELAQIPIILLTAHTGEDHEVECLRAGADDFVSKPVNIAVLRARIETHQRLYAMRDELQAQKAELEKWRGDYEIDLDAARSTQQAIIPQETPALPGWDFATCYRPLIQVGGDVFDWLRLSDGGRLFWIADATGHGVSAALLTTLTKLLFRHASSESDSPATIMESVNRDFRSVLKRKSFMTAACAVLHPDSGELTTCGAGHPPLLIARKNGVVESIPSSAPPLGLAHQEALIENRCVLAPGDSFLLYTDGLFTTPAASGQRVMDLSPDLEPAGNAADFLARLLRKVSDGGRTFTDDVAAIAGTRQ
jgi:sigma-B regulation protein RsbU (phosphoserine phosphatase)